MIYKWLLLLLMIPVPSIAAECTLYERSHPAYTLDGSHLSSGKCYTCASCHINGIFRGTPKTCIACHNGDPSRMTVGRSTAHIPTQVVDCNNCHKTLTFTIANMNHNSVALQRCDSCHNGAYTQYNAKGKNRGHPKTVADCGQCHNTRSF